MCFLNQLKKSMLFSIYSSFAISKNCDKYSYLKQVAKKFISNYDYTFLNQKSQLKKSNIDTKYLITTRYSPKKGYGRVECTQTWYRPSKNNNNINNDFAIEVETEEMAPKHCHQRFYHPSQPTLHISRRIDLLYISK